MITPTTTRLLDDLRSANPSAWSDFDARYRPILLSFAQKLGFLADDAEEFAQQTMAEFCCCFRAGNYDRDRGRPRAWMIGIARNVAVSMRRRRPAERVGGNCALDDIPDESELTRIWENERQQAIFSAALERLRDSTRTDLNPIQAFELYAIHGLPVEDVAQHCGLSIDSVYVAKNRLTAACAILLTS